MLCLFGFVLANHCRYPPEHHQSLLKQWKRLNFRIYHYILWTIYNIKQGIFSYLDNVTHGVQNYNTVTWWKLHLCHFIFIVIKHFNIQVRKKWQSWMAVKWGSFLFKLLYTPKSAPLQIVESAMCMCTTCNLPLMPSGDVKRDFPQFCDSSPLGCQQKKETPIQ